MAEKKSFMVYLDNEKHLKMLSDEQAGKLFRALLRFAKSGEEPDFTDGMLAMAFSFMSAQIERDMLKYEETCRRRSENGKKGGRPKANAFSEKQNKANKADTERETETVTEKETETGTERETEKETDIMSSPTPTPSSSSSSFSSLKSFGSYSHVKLTQEQYDSLCSDYSESNVSDYIRKMDEWLQVSGKRPYSDFNLAIRKWLEEDNVRKKCDDYSTIYRSSDPNDAPF